MARLFLAKVTMSAAATSPPLDTSQLFDAGYREGKESAIDEFLRRLQVVNQLAPKPQEYNLVQAQLVLLGVVAAVESYLRSILRRVIAVDPVAQGCVHRREVTYGAALHLSTELLPEAILERISFISKESIVDSLRDLIGMKGELPADLQVAIGNYVRVCQLRHCAVHRFGKLGVNNAIALGLADHSELLEKPLAIDYGALQAAIAIATGFVKTINNALFNAVVSRIHWTWSYAVDRPRYAAYHYLFADTVSSIRTPSPKANYRLFASQWKKFNQKT